MIQLLSVRRYYLYLFILCSLEFDHTEPNNRFPSFHPQDFRRGVGTRRLIFDLYQFRRAPISPPAHSPKGSGVSITFSSYPHVIVDPSDKNTLSYAHKRLGNNVIQLLSVRRYYLYLFILCSLEFDHTEPNNRFPSFHPQDFRRGVGTRRLIFDLYQFRRAPISPPAHSPKGSGVSITFSSYPHVIVDPSRH